MTSTTGAELDVHRGGLPLATISRPLIRWSVLFGAGMLLSFAGLLVWRRMAGALSNPLPATALSAIGLATAAVVAAIRIAWRRVSSDRLAGAVVFVALTLSVATVAIAVSIPESSPLGLGLLWLAILVGEAWAWSPGLPGRAGRWRVERKARRPAAPLVPRQPRIDPAALAPVSDGEPLGENVTQQFTRLVEADGTDRLQGWLRVAFAEGQRLVSVHVAFCPPFGGAPEAELAQIEGPEVRIKKVQVLPFGARFDLKLAAPAGTSLEVLLQFTAEVCGSESPHPSPLADDARG